MLTITTHQELRSAWVQDFCYLCGKPFEDGEVRSKDHVPPRALFGKDDRNPPLILPTHEVCNSARSSEDEVLGQLVSVLHGKHPRPERLRLAVEFFEGHGAHLMAGLGNLAWTRMVFRCVRGFHTALYKQFVTDKGGFIYSPLPATDVVEGRLVPVHDDPGRLAMTRALKQHRAIDRVDRVQCCNGKCLFECVWAEFEDGCPFCLFGLRIYNWEDLGDPSMGSRRGCIGWYFADDPPEGAARCMEVEHPEPGGSPLDPFAC